MFKSFYEFEFKISNYVFAFISRIFYDYKDSIGRHISIK